MPRLGRQGDLKSGPLSPFGRAFHHGSNRLGHTTGIRPSRAGLGTSYLQGHATRVRPVSMPSPNPLHRLARGRHLRATVPAVADDVPHTHSKGVLPHCGEPLSPDPSVGSFCVVTLPARRMIPTGRKQKGVPESTCSCSGSSTVSGATAMTLF